MGFTEQTLDASIIKMDKQSIYDVIPSHLLQEMIDKKYVEKRCHRDYPGLLIYNYSNTAQYDKVWNPATLNCRGLICYKDQIVSRPFGKFFNGNQIDSDILNTMLKQDYVAYEKYDGFLGVSYYHDEKWRIASRGSFHSNYAETANDIFDRKYSHLKHDMDCDKTYCFEIISPKHRVILDYGHEEKMILLAVRKTLSDTDLDLCKNNPGFEQAVSYDSRDYQTLLRDRPDAEGYVIVFEDGSRVKVKHSSYLTASWLVRKFNKKHVWEMLSSGNVLDEEELLKLPDEYYDRVKEYADSLQKDYDRESAHYIDYYREYVVPYVRDMNDAAEVAQRILSCDITLRKGLFNLYNEKPMDKLIWKSLKPKAELI